MKELTLGEKGLEFLRSFINDGNYLGKEAAAALGNGGQVLTWLPDEVDLVDVSFVDGWRHDGLVTEDICKPFREITGEFLRKDSKNIAISECSTQQAADLPTQLRLNGFPNGLSYFFCDGSTHQMFEPETRMQCPDLVSVFGFQSGTETTASEVSELVRSAFPFHEIYVLTSMPDGKMLETATKVERNYIQRLATQAEYIAIGAYDGNGIILWKRT